MAYNPQTGQWKPEDESVEGRVNQLTSKQSPLMKQAGARGAQASNRRGLLNSSMGVQAGQTAALNAALPIASQEAQQAHQTNTSRMNVAANEREKASGLAAAFESNYSQMVSTIMNNPEIPKKVRQQYLDHAAMVRDSNMRMVEQMYGVDLQWDTPSSTNPPPSADPPDEGSSGQSGGLVGRMNELQQRNIFGNEMQRESTSQLLSLGGNLRKLGFS